MHDGRVVQMGTPEELFECPAHTFVGYFIGSPGMNLLPARVEGSVARIDGEEIPLGGHYRDLGGKVEIGIRPEYVRLSRDEGVPAQIRRVEDVGRHRIVRADVFGREIAIVVGEDEPVGADMTRVVFDPKRIIVYVDDWREAPIGNRQEEAA